MKNRAKAIMFLAMTLFARGALAQEASVTILGAVKHPGTYSLSEGEKLSSLIERAGGFSDNAWLRGAALSRESAGAKKGELLRDRVSRLEREVFAMSGEEEQKRVFVMTLSGLKPGRTIPVRLAHPRLLKGSRDDLPLEGGDALFVPSRTGIVTVIGAVKMPGAVSPLSPKTDPEDCIRMAGGFGEDADRKHAYILKADGTAIPLSREWIRWNLEESRWEIPAFREPTPRVEPGDTVVVPKKPVRSAWARAIKDLPRLLMEIHALTGVRVDPP
jgi:protein involved in polysaccharide export with SLBB domain